MDAPEGNAIIDSTRKQKERDGHDDNRRRHGVETREMTNEVGQGSGHQATDGGEQHQALVNIASVSVQESRRHQDPKRNEITERIDYPEERIGFDMEVAAQIKAASRHRDCCHVSQNDHDRGEEDGCRPESAMHWSPPSGYKCRLRKEQQEPSGVNDAVRNGKRRGRSLSRGSIKERWRIALISLVEGGRPARVEGCGTQRRSSGVGGRDGAKNRRNKKAKLTAPHACLRQAGNPGVIGAPKFA